MPSYLSPGVYVEEVESGSRPIEGVGTSIAAFVGFAQKGPFDEPTLITNWTQYVTTFGDFVDGTYLASSVYGFFSNGGGVCYVVRIGDGTSVGDETGELAAGAEVQIGPYAVKPRPGVTGEITVEVTAAEGDDPPSDTFQLIVRRDGQVAETYPSVTTKRSKENVATRVNAKSELIEIRDPGRGAAPARPEPQTVALAPAAPAAPPPAVPVRSHPRCTSATPTAGQVWAVWRRSRRSR